MDDTADQLAAFADNLQQSMGNVFDRVNQSLTQSHGVMEMMNSMLESALLQSIRLDVEYDAEQASLVIVVVNASKMELSDVDVSVRLELSEEPTHSERIDTLRAEDEHKLQIPVQCSSQSMIQGKAEVMIPSPGTQQPLHKAVDIYVPIVQQGTWVSCASPLPTDSTVIATSETVSLYKLRDILQVKPLEGLLIASNGHYSFTLADKKILLSIKPDDSSSTGAVQVLSNDASAMDISIKIADEMNSLCKRD